MTRRFYRMLFLWRRWRLRRAFLALEQHYGQFACGMNLAEEIRPSLYARRVALDHAIADLKEFERLHRLSEAA